MKVSSYFIKRLLWTVALVLFLVSPPLEPDPSGSVDSQNSTQTQNLTQETFEKIILLVIKCYLKNKFSIKMARPTFREINLKICKTPVGCNKIMPRAGVFLKC